MLLRFLAELTQSLKRVPTPNDLKYAHRSRKPAFPSSKTFATRFGGFRGLAPKLSEWCSSHPDFAQAGEIARAKIDQQEVEPADEAVDSRGPGLLAEPTGDSLNEWTPPVVAELSQWSRRDPLRFERGVANAFRCLGFEVEELGQGTQRNPDGLVLRRSQYYALLYDAKAREREDFKVGTHDRAFAEYLSRHRPRLEKEGMKQLTFVVVGSRFSPSTVPEGLRFVGRQQLKAMVFLEADALVAMVGLHLKHGHHFDTDNVKPLFEETRIMNKRVVEDHVKALLQPAEAFSRSRRR